MKKLCLVFLFTTLAYADYAPWRLDVPEYFRGTCTPDNQFCVYFSPSDMPLEAVRGYLQSARKSIRIATYSADFVDYGQILNHKAKDGLQVELAMDYKNSYTAGIWPVVDAGNPNITKYRIPVLQGGNPQMHNKLILIDDEVLLFGSANHTPFGLLGNYENVVMTRNKEIIAKYRNEMDELRTVSVIVCDLFGRGNCQKGPERYEPFMHEYLTTGQFDPQIIDQKEGECGRLTTDDFMKKVALVDEVSNPTLPQIDRCFKDKEQQQKIKELLERVAKTERYVDGTLTSKEPIYWKRLDPQRRERYRVYFSPEDNVQQRIVQELRKTLWDPQDSFVFFSTNFISNGTLAKELAILKGKDVFMRGFFDRGRFVEPQFQSQLDRLSALGFFGDPNIIDGTLNSLKMKNLCHPSDFRNQITIFDNQLTGPYGCNHNKWAVLGTKKGLTLIDGSANWSGGAMRINGENLLIAQDEALATIFLREMLSQLYIYRYGQDLNSKEFWNDVNYLASKARCLKAVLGLEESCQIGGQKWNPPVRSSIIVSIYNVPAGPGDKVCLYSPQLNDNKGGAIPLYTSEEFAGKWLAAIPAPIGWKIDFHVYIDGKMRDKDRTVVTPKLGIFTFPGHYEWGK
jgi:hypothetical protein